MADDDKDPDNIEEDFDDFGFGDDEEESTSEEEDVFGPEVTEPTAEPASEARFSDETPGMASGSVPALHGVWR